jgi:hypothetical protein
MIQGYSLYFLLLYTFNVKFVSVFPILTDPDSDLKVATYLYLLRLDTAKKNCNKY